MVSFRSALFGTIVPFGFAVQILFHLLKGVPSAFIISHSEGLQVHTRLLVWIGPLSRGGVRGLSDGTFLFRQPSWVEGA